MPTAAHLFDQDTLMLQRFLKFAGFDPGKLDGVYGPRTDNAADAFYETTRTIAVNLGSFDGRSEKYIASLLPAAQRAARRFLANCKAAGLDARIISGTRSYAEQDALYAKGRINIGGMWTRVPGTQKVTNARGGHSWHNFGLAFDIGLFEGRAYVLDDARYNAASVHANDLPLGWGGNWKGSLKDPPHYQLKGDYTIGDARKAFEAGQLFTPALGEA
jgi:peptidoglycan LD-endopeptidase CwlK